MRARLASGLGVLVSAILACSSIAGVAPHLDPGRMVAAHNRLRAAVGVGPVRWSAQLADAASRWASHLTIDGQCVMNHSGSGENLYWASSRMWSDGWRERQPISEDDVLSSWASEGAFFDYGSNSCRQGKICGHYTQVVWRDTVEIGCARRFCADQGQIWVCHYRPFGNVIGEKPY